MRKQPYMQFFTGDWLKDPALAMCSPETRGIWIDFLCGMHELDQCGVIAGTREQLSRLGRCSLVQLDQALSELSTFKAADVTHRNGIVTLVNRRMKREDKARKDSNLRVKRHREKCGCNGKDMPTRTNTHIQIGNLTIPNTPLLLPPESQAPPEKPGEIAAGGQDAEGRNKKFVPPKPKEVSEYAEGIGFQLDGGTFCDYYAARGWKLSGNVPMKDWKATVRTWKKNQAKREADGSGESAKIESATEGKSYAV